MGPFGRSANDVEREYSYRIENLLQEFDPRSLQALRRNRDFGVLQQWARNTWTQKLTFEGENQQLARDLKKARGEVNSLSRRLQETLERVTDLDNLNKGIQISHDQVVQSLNESHRKAVKALNDDNENIVKQLQGSHDAERTKLSDRINELLSDIMIAQADSRAWTDEKLKSKFGALKSLLDQITSPHFTVVMQDLGDIRRRIDPDGFLGRSGFQNSHFLLRNTVFNVLQHFFFSSPWGFGALGPGSGRSALVGIYGAWRAIFGDSDTSDSALSQVFTSGWEANNWRSVTFESLMASVLFPTESSESDFHSTLHDMYESNIRACSDEITSLLYTVSGHVPSQQTIKSIQKLSRSAAELGLQFGVQRSGMRLVRPAHKQPVEIGKEFVDCADGDKDKGKKVRVDIVASPGLNRVGDGKEDFLTDIFLVPCSIYPMSS